MLDFIRKHIWEHLPKEASTKTLVSSAVIWAVLLPGGAWLFHYWGRFERTTALIFTAVGVVLGVAQLLPGVGEKVYLGILRVSAIFGYFIFRILLTLVFFLLVTPMGFGLRLAGKDPLELHPKSGVLPFWHAHTRPSDARRYYRLF